MASNMNLEQFLQEECNDLGEFTPYCEVSELSDALTFYFSGEPDYSKRLTDHVTLYLSLETKEIVGCRIKGISGLLEDLPNYIEVNHGGIELSLIFLSFRGEAADDSVRRIFNELGKAASDRNMSVEPA